MSEISILRIRVLGRVQGVGFRAHVAQAGQALHLTGWVRNRPDGSVEVLAGGELRALQELAGVCRQGPHGSRVDNVTCDEEEGAPAALPFPFAVLPTG